MPSFDVYEEINSLDELMFIAGDEQSITFFVIDETSNPIDLTTAAEVVWLLAPYGNPDMPVLDVDGVLGSEVNEVLFSITASDTEDLSGKFIQQLLIVDFLGSEYRPVQGIVTILPQIARL